MGRRIGREQNMVPNFGDAAGLPSQLETFQALVDAHDQGIFALDRELRYTAFNDAHETAMRELYGAEIAIGGRLSDYQTVEADREGACVTLERALAGERIVVNAFSGAEGRRRPFEIVHTPQTDASGTVLGVMIRAYDVTERRRAEAALRENRALLQAIIEGIPDAVYVKDVEGRYLLFNAAAERFTGKRAAEVLGHDDRFLFPTDEAHVLMAGDREVMDKAAPTTYEETVSGAAGKLTTFLSTRGPVYDEGGELLGLFGISRDVTERRAAEEELRESEAYLEAILDSTADGILAVDNRGKVLKANRRFAELWRIPEALLRVADDAALLAFVVDQLSEPQAFVAKVQSLYESDATDVDTVIFKDGRAFERHSAATMQGSAVTGRVWSFHDITERKQREEKLRLSQQRLSLHVEQTPLAVIEFDLGGRVREWNPAAAALFGYSREAAIGEYWTFIVPAAIHGQLEGVWAAIVGQRGGNRSTNENVTKDGRTISCEWFSTPLVGPGGRTIGVASLIQDVTEREQAEEEIRRQAEQLRRTVEGTVLAMSQVVESRDPYTAGHERRVAELATAIAAEMGMGGEELTALRIAGLLHDIGKIAVPAEILAKPGRLSEMEFNLIKQHPASGFEILTVIDFGLPVAEMVLQHHERLDGSGYPRGLAGEEVLPEARILAVADVVEAMSSHRPYRASLGMEAALAEVREHAGVKYDAAVVSACVRLVEEQGFTFAS